MKISVFESVKSTKPIQNITLTEFVSLVRDPARGDKRYITASEIVNRIRAISDEDQQKELKQTLPAISPGVEFGEDRQDIKSYSGLMQIDIDHVQNPEQLRNSLGVYSWVTLSALSVRKGVWLLIKIPEPERQSEYWSKVNTWLKDRYGYEADAARKNPKDLRFYAPDNAAIFNPDAIVLRPLPATIVPNKDNVIPNVRKLNTELNISPIDDYNNRADVIPMLLLNNWKIFNNKGNNVRLTRPGKRRGISANWNEDFRKLYVFTSNTTLHNANSSHALSPVDIYMNFNHIISISEAREKLHKLGYGSQPSLIRLQKRIELEINPTTNTK